MNAFARFQRKDALVYTNCAIRQSAKQKYHQAQDAFKHYFLAKKARARARGCNKPKLTMKVVGRAQETQPLWIQWKL
jgi:hypothetical protein